MKQTFIALSVMAALISCEDKDIDIPLPPPSSGSTMQLEGLTGNEPNNDGAMAGNAVYVDFSTDRQVSVLRNSWDLGFYAGSDFKVTINMFNGASAVQVNKTDINSVSVSDIDRDTLRVGLNGFAPVGSFAVLDDPREDNILTKTAIAPISANDADNKVYVLNRKGGDASADDANLYKVRILRKGSGYSLQYAKLNETTFKTLDITKNNSNNFQFASVVSGSLMNVEPEKANWDIVWTWSMNYTGTVPYAFSDLVITNSLAGTSAYERSYTTEELANQAYNNFNKDSVAKYTYSSKRDAIGSKWRTAGMAGSTAKKDRFYIVKDSGGNVYKLKFISMGTLDAGTRGKPEIKYELIK